VRAIRIDEGSADRTTIGHFDPYLTHRLNPGPAIERDNLLELKEEWETQSADVPLEFNGSELRSLGRTTPLNPYLNVQVDKSLIPNHNDIWGTAIQDFVAELILISTTP